jgi:hypothetical protein
MVAAFAPAQPGVEVLPDFVFVAAAAGERMELVRTRYFCITLSHHARFRMLRSHVYSLSMVMFLSTDMR